MAVFVLGPTGDLPSSAVMRTSSVLAGLGLPDRMTDPGLWEFLYNIALFVPVTCVCGLLWRRMPVLGWAALGLVVSLGVESVQALLLDGRTPQVSDVVANTLGAVVGSLLARFIWELLDRRRAQVCR